MTPLLEAKNIDFSYGNKKILTQFSCQVAKGERLCFLGASGCGKTTFLRLCAGLESPESGQIYLRNQLVSSPQVVLKPAERRLGFVFQNFALFDKIDIKKNILYGCKNPKDIQEAERMIEMLDLTSHLDKYPHQLSGGEKQKVALARTMALSPDLILMDEPFSNIDPEQTEFLIQEFAALFEKLQVTVVMVTHSLQEADQFATRTEQFLGLCP